MQLSSITTPISTAASTVFSGIKSAGQWGAHVVTVIANKGYEGLAWTGAVLSDFAKSATTFCKANAKPITITLVVGASVIAIALLAKHFFANKAATA